MCKYERFYKYALEVETGYYVVPKYARKDKKYTCIKCEKECIVCEGEIKEKYIRHKVKGECNYFDASLKNTQNNKYDPKIRDLFHNASIVYLENFLNKGHKLVITKKCKLKYKCNNIVKEIKLEDGDNVKVEKSFNLNGMIKRGDLCILNKDGNIKVILEIFDTHRTNENDRPNNIEWYELYVDDIMKYYDDDEDYDKINLDCHRYYVCNPCENHREEILKQQKEEYERRQKQKEEYEQRQKQLREEYEQKQKQLREELERIKQKQKEELEKEKDKQKEEYEQRLIQKQKEEYEQILIQKQKQRLKDFNNYFLLRIYFQLWYTTIMYPQAQVYQRFLIEKYDYHNIYQKHLKYNDYTKNYLKNKYQNDEKYKKYMQEKSKRQYERKKKDILRIKMSH